MTISPKVKASAWTGLALTALATILAGITPGMLESLGVWAGPVFILIGAVGQAIAGYQKADPDRDAGIVQKSAESIPLGVVPAYPPTEPAAAAAEVQQVYPAEDDVPGRHEATS